MNFSLCERIIENISREIVGKRHAIELLLVAFIADGHALIEDVPGLGKTLMAKSLARTIGGTFKRVQFTPDLLPADITGFNVYNQQAGHFTYQSGPVITNILLAVGVSQFETANASESFERTLEVVGSLAVQSHHKGFALGLVTNGVVEGGPSILPMGSSPQQLPSILEILARLKMKANENLADTLYRALELPWGVSCVHFAYEQDEGARATAQYFSHRRIPVIFIVCSSGAPWAGDGHKLGGKTYCLDELHIEEAQKP